MKLAALALMCLAGALFCGCEARSVEDLPRSTRIDRDIVARASLALSESQGAAVARDATFFTRDDGTFVFHMSHDSDPQNPMYHGVSAFARQVSVRSGGTMAVEVFGGPDSLGSDAALVAMVTEGRLDSAMVQLWSAWSGMSDLANLESLPFLFSDVEEAMAAYTGALGEWVAENVINPTGSVVIGWQKNGFRHFTNNVRPIFTPADVAGLRMRSPRNEIHLAFYDAMGAGSVAMDFGEVRDAIDRGLVNGQDNPIGNIFAARLAEVQDYLSLSYHMFSAAPFVVSRDLWDALTDGQRGILVESAAAANDFNMRVTEEMERTMLNALIAGGMQVNEADAGSFFDDALLLVWETHMDSFGREFVDIAAGYVSDPSALVHLFSSAGPPAGAEPEDEGEEEE